MAIDIHKTEVETISKIFKKSGIRYLPEIKIKIDGNKTDIDVFGIHKNIVFLVECFGTEEFGPKLKKTITEFKFIKDNFEQIKEILKKDYPTMYTPNKDFLESSSLIFRHLIVSLKKETLKDIDETHSEMIKKESFGVWTHEEIYYYDQISDCTYNHCKYEIFGNLNVAPTDIEDGKEPNIPY